MGYDLNLFMHNILTSPYLKYVLCVCSSDYVQKADTNRGGVGFEATIISRDMLSAAGTNRFIPIIRDNPEATMPVFLGNRLYCDLRNDDNFQSQNFEQLCQTIAPSPFPNPLLSFSVMASMTGVGSVGSACVGGVIPYVFSFLSLMCRIRKLEIENTLEQENPSSKKSNSKQQLFPSTRLKALNKKEYFSPPYIHYPPKYVVEFMKLLRQPNFTDKIIIFSPDDVKIGETSCTVLMSDVSLREMQAWEPFLRDHEYITPVKTKLNEYTNVTYYHLSSKGKRRDINKDIEMGWV